MESVNTKIKFTYKDYKSLPESETKRYETYSIYKKTDTLPLIPGLRIKLTEVF